jgi:hypothetical protein
MAETVTKDNLQGGYKADSGKPRISLVPTQFITALAHLFTLGAKKYAAWNWWLGMNFSRPYDALQRHAMAWYEGEEHDPTDGQHHLIACAWNCCVLYFYSAVQPNRYKKFDDRPKNLNEDVIRNSINTDAKA